MHAATGLVQILIIRLNRNLSAVCLGRFIDVVAYSVTHKERFAVDAELKRSAKGVIDRILHLRDSL
jgi:hypothetical protein